MKNVPCSYVPLNDDGTPDLDALNAEFDEVYLRDKHNPRWVAKPTVAYLWARTVTCKNCRATLPLLKTRWLCKKDKKRVVLTMQPNEEITGVVFGVQSNVPVQGNTPVQRREHDKQIGGGTMSRSGATCPCCGAIMTMQDIRMEGQAERLGAVLTSVVVDGLHGKEYRLPIEDEIRLATETENELEVLYSQIPFGLPDEQTPAGGGSGAGRAFSVQGYGLMRWRDLFTSRQLLSLGVFTKYTNNLKSHMQGYSPNWVESIAAYLACNLSKTVHLGCTLCTWHQGNQQIRQVFSRYALPITWDFAESVPSGHSAGSYYSMLDSIALAVDTVLGATSKSVTPKVFQQSATNQSISQNIDLILTDPPYYDAIPYSDVMDFFYIWLRRTLFNLTPDINSAMNSPLSPKWDKDKNDGELIDDSSRFDGDGKKSKTAYEDGMYRAFQACIQCSYTRWSFSYCFCP